MMRELFFKSLKFIPLILWVSCTVNRPVINDSDWNLTFVNDLKINKQYETLEFFVNATDEDGEGDISTIFLIDDNSGLYCELEKENFSRRYINKEFYIGSENIVMPNRDSIPRSKYRLIVRDLAGETTEDTFFITKRRISVEELEFPKLVIDGESFNIENYQEGRLEVYTDNMQVMTGLVTNENRTFYEIFERDIDEININSEIYVVVDNVDLKLKSGPYIISE